MINQWTLRSNLFFFQRGDYNKRQVYRAHEQFSDPKFPERHFLFHHDIHFIFDQFEMVVYEIETGEAKAWKLYRVP